MEIENINTLNHALMNGINLFVGAGFSTLAKDRNNRLLPCGADFALELAEKFGKNKTFSLPQLSSILESTHKTEFHSYLKDRFTVDYIDPLYNNLLCVDIKSIYTTNIDDLIVRLYRDVPGKFLNDLYINGLSPDKNAVNYLSLHGSVSNEQEKLVFDVGSLASIFNDVPRIWSCLARELEIRPTVFVGYGFNDNSVIQTILTQQTFQDAKKDIWVVLRKKEKEFAEYYKALGLKIIQAELDEFLEFLSSFRKEKSSVKPEEQKLEILKPYLVPKGIHGVEIQRPIKDFFGGSAPKWCDIFGGQLHSTHFFSSIMDSIYDKSKNTIIIGAPVTGKTTLLMTAAKECNNIGLKLYFDSLSKERAEYITKVIDNDKTVVFLDNLYDSIDAIKYLEKPNIKLVCADRSHNYGIISHLLDPDLYTIINVTTLNDSDIQAIFNALPESIRGKSLVKESEKSDYDKDSLFEFVVRNVNLQNVKERYTKAIQDLEKNDFDLAEFLVLCAYMHSCHVPLSIETAIDYFDNYSINDFFDLKEDAIDIIKDYIPNDNLAYADMDYYYPRSHYIAEVIMDACSSDLLSKIISTVVERVSPIRICNYRTFHKYAFDKNLILKAFPYWRDGKDLYEKAFLYDNRNPYVLQQGALYLAQKKKYDLAFEWIDRAISATDDKYFSIRNTHAIILFNANFDKNDITVRHQLDKSMSILEKCMSADSRKRFHAIVFASQAIKYYSLYPDDTAKRYLSQASEWLKKEMNRNSWDSEIVQTHKSVTEILAKL